MPNPAHLLDIITLIILGEEFKSSLLAIDYVFLRRYVNSSLLLSSIALPYVLPFM
jgi:hypothetical protein